MNSYRIRLELRSPLGTPLAADTLWGHIAWGIRYRSGTSALEDWLAAHDSGTPPLVLSDPLPAGYWPRPLLPPAARSAAPPDRDTAQQQKSLARRDWIDHDAWSAVHAAVSPRSVQMAVKNTQPPPAAHEGVVMHASINRLTGGTAQAGGGTLFSRRQTYFDASPQFDVWTLSPEPAETVRQWFEDGLSGGYGRDAATGCGHLVVRDVTTEALPCPESPNAAVLLAPTVPRPGDPARGFFRPGIRAGRLGGEFAIGMMPDGTALQRQKRPVRCLLAGTVLFGDDPPPWIGRTLSGVHEQLPNVRQYGISPLLPCRLDPAIIAEASAHTTAPLPGAAS